MSDSNFSNVSLLLPFSGENTSTTFTDYSVYLKTISVVGNTQISTTQSKWGTGSAYFDGTGDYLSISATTNVYVTSSYDFTIELWFNTTQTGRAYATLISRGTAGFYDGSWTIMASGATSGVPTIYWADYSGGGPLMVSSTGGYNDGNWHHLAWVRYGNVHSLYLDGISKASVTTAAIMANCRTPLIIGTDVNYGPRAYLGYIQDVRITINNARYTANFTPPSIPFYYHNYRFVSLLLPFTGDNFSTKFNDCSLNNNPISVYGNTKIKTDQSKWEYGSAYFNGNGDYLEFPYPLSNFNGNVTIECFFKLESIPSGILWYNSFYLLAAGPPNANPGLDFAIGNTQIWFNQNNHSNRILSGSWTADLNWHHIAVTRFSNSWFMFLDGIQIATNTSSSAFATSTNMVISKCAPTGGETEGNFHGYLQDFRITKGVALYTTNFTPPTEPFYYPFKKDISFSIVSLLLPFNGANNSTTFIDKSSSPKTITPFGNAKISTTQSKWGDGSAYFDGSGDYLTIPNDDDFNFGTNDFTIEVWVYVTALGNYNAILDGRSYPGYQNFTFGLWNVSGSLYLDSVNAGGRYTSASTISLNTWNHIAFVRSGNSITGFINGVKDSNSMSYSGSYTAPRSDLWIGAVIDPQYFFGYMQDLRITKGVARYTSNFDISLEPFYFPYNSSLSLHLDGENNSTIFTDTSTNPKNVTAISGAKISTTQLRFGTGSLLLNGSSDYLQLEYSSDFDFGTEPFTYECWCYVTAFGEYRLFARSSSSYYLVRESSLMILNSTTLSFYYGVRGSNQTSYNFTVSAMPTSSWFHIAFIRDSSAIFKVFVNGVASGNTYTDAINLNSPMPLYIGAFISGVIYSPFNGYMDEIRITKGLARYTSNFIPPTEPFPDDFKIIFNYKLMSTFLQCNPGKISGLPINKNLKTEIPFRDYEDGGSYFIEGNVNVDSVPSSRKVRLHLLSNGRIIRQCWSNSTTGYFRFDDLKFQEYFLWSEDYKKVYSPISKVVGDLLNNNFRNQQLSFASSSPIPSSPSDITKQFIGYESFFGIFNTSEPSLETISYLLESSNIKGTFKIIGQYYINNILMAGKELILLDKNYYKLEMTISDENGDYIFNDLFYDSYYIASSEDNVQNIILGPILPIPQ